VFPVRYELNFYILFRKIYSLRVELSTLKHSSVFPFLVTLGSLQFIWGYSLGCPLTQADSRRLHNAEALVRPQRGHMEFVVGKWGRFSPNTPFSLINSHSTNCSTFINDPGMTQYSLDTDSLVS
jgi:hypothetical protein